MAGHHPLLGSVDTNMIQLHFVQLSQNMHSDSGTYRNAYHKYAYMTNITENELHGFVYQTVG